MVLLEERVPEDEVLVPAARRIARVGEELRSASRMLKVMAARVSGSGFEG